jgi:hydroxymethylbilane synthase
VIDGDLLTLCAAVLAPDGSRRVADEAEGPAVDAERIGQALAERMLEQGARELLAMQR